MQHFLIKQIGIAGIGTYFDDFRYARCIEVII